MKQIQGDDEHFTNNDHQVTSEQTEKVIALLTRNSSVARISAIVLTLAFIILCPWAMYGIAYVFSKNLFTGWVVLGIIWLFLSFFIVGIHPIVEGRRGLVSVVKKIFDELHWKRKSLF